jgi:hypothetical protein
VKPRGVELFLILSFSRQLRMVPTEMTAEIWLSKLSLSHQPAQQSSSTSLPDGQHVYCTPYPLYMSQYQGLSRQCRDSNRSCSGSTDERERFRLHREHGALSRVGKMVRVGLQQYQLSSKSDCGQVRGFGRVRRPVIASVDFRNASRR